MAKQRSKASRYPSRFGGGFVAAGQYLAEYACERQAINQGERLGVKFWEDGPWKGVFTRQVIQANKLLTGLLANGGTREEWAGAVVDVLEANPTLYSLAYPGLARLVVEERQRRLAPSPLPVSRNVVYRPVEPMAPSIFGADRHSVVGRLRELEE